MGVAPSGSGGIQLDQILLGLLLDLGPHVAKVLGERRPVARDVFEHHLED